MDFSIFPYVMCVIFRSKFDMFLLFACGHTFASAMFYFHLPHKYYFSAISSQINAETIVGVFALLQALAAGSCVVLSYRARGAALHF